MINILHADNAPDTLELAKMILEKSGCKVTDAALGKECLEKLASEKFDLVLLDIMMPDMSGWDVFQIIMKKNRKQKVAFLSVIEVSKERKAKLKKEGLADYILKPFTESELVQKVKAIVRS
jgi:CheY-like chemotaxis protein